ncbi:SDR family oxidoreductase [Nisaea acidiphila]|uniref:SDR family oxidoreductase n=1 Tax=Nisaea acidiphila TaxID=1862145 RepID=A0A9J7ATN2_9PROT|nr:SDR family oxidoreductase [Nisaea acidiphila]UUX49684.1 SDR family oxidoreductase [Nisaea acidiphila]
MKKAIVTGHSKGLGAGITSALLAEGYNVLGLSRSALPGFESGLEQVALDLGDPAALEAWLDSGELAGFLEHTESAILVNNAGIVEPIAPLGRQGAAAIARAVTVNVSAALVLADAFVTASEDVADRRLVHISSGAGRHAYSGWSVYCATKAALDHHARGVAADTIAGLKVESLAPGTVDTGMQATIRATSEEDFSHRERFVGLKESGALGDPETVGAKIVAHVTSTSFGAELVTDIREM